MNESAGAVKAYGDAANSGKAGTLELIALSQAVADAAMSQADGVLAAAENTAKLNGQTLDAGQKTSIFKQALLDFANSLPDLSPLKGQILDLASGFTDIPSDKTITVSALPARDAAIDLTDVRTQQDKILPTTSISTEVRNQALTWGLLEAVRLKGVEVDQLAPTVSVSVQGHCDGDQPVAGDRCGSGRRSRLLLGRRARRWRRRSRRRRRSTSCGRGRSYDAGDVASG